MFCPTEQGTTHEYDHQTNNAGPQNDDSDSDRTSAAKARRAALELPIEPKPGGRRNVPRRPLEHIFGLLSDEDVAP